MFIDQIHSLDGHLWRYNDFYTDSGNPYEQAESHLYAALGMIDRQPQLRRRVRGRALVTLPNITRAQWNKKRFDTLPCSPPIIFKDDLQADFLQGIHDAPLVQYGQGLDVPRWQMLCHVFGNRSLLVNTSVSTDMLTAPQTPAITKKAAIEQANQYLDALDIQQEAAAKQIPDGPQRIRGIAGSGKTILLCQKAVMMHLKHPEWDIALVFFTRSLYEVVVSLIERYMLQFTQGELHYNPQQSRLKVLHAWGQRSSRTLLGSVCCDRLS